MAGMNLYAGESDPKPKDETASLKARVVVLEAALKEISKGEGPYSHDHLQHADNCIDSMKAIALAALDTSQ